MNLFINTNYIKSHDSFRCCDRRLREDYVPVPLYQFVVRLCVCLFVCLFTKITGTQDRRQMLLRIVGTNCVVIRPTRCRGHILKITSAIQCLAHIVLQKFHKKIKPTWYPLRHANAFVQIRYLT